MFLYSYRLLTSVIERVYIYKMNVREINSVRGEKKMFPYIYLSSLSFLSMSRRH